MINPRREAALPLEMTTAFATADLTVSSALLL